MENCVQYFVEGRNAWKEGLLGFFTRIRGLIMTVVLTILTMGAPFWWPEKLPQKFEIQLKYAVLTHVGAFGVISLIAFFYLRSRSRRSLDIKFHLHSLTHYLRDSQTKFFKLVQERSGSSAKLSSHEKEVFHNYVENFCERTKIYYKELTGDKTIEVAIRLAIDVSKKQGQQEIVYKTIGRSSGLSKERDSTSEAISANEGIPRFLSEKKNSKGVLVYTDLKQAAEYDAFKETPNEKLYPDEIKTMMVTPLNAWGRKSQRMIGIIYITSRESKTFKFKHTDSMRFIADMIANSIAFAVYKLKSKGN